MSQMFQPGSSQSYNRYTYALNNPLKYTDPGGYLKKRFYWDPPDENWWNVGNFGNGAIAVNPYAFPGYQGSIGPGSGNHWSDYIRSEYGNYMLMSGRTFNNVYGEGSTDIAEQITSYPAALKQWINGDISLAQIRREGGFWVDVPWADDSWVSNITYDLENGVANLPDVDVISRWVSVGSDGWGELTELSAGTERGIGLGGSLWGGAATMTYADDIANGVSTTTKGMAYLRVGGNALGGLGFAATTYNNVVKIQNGTLNTAGVVDWGISGGMLLTGVLISNPVGLTVLAVGGIGYGVYRLAAGDAADAWINENFGFRP